MISIRTKTLISGAMLALLAVPFGVPALSPTASGALASSTSAVSATDPPAFASLSGSKLRGDLGNVMANAGPNQLIPISVVMTAQADRAKVAAIGQMHNKPAQRQAIKNLLKPLAAQSQAGLVAMLQTQQAAGNVGPFIRKLWIHNVVGAQTTAGVIRQVAARPDVAYINYDRPIGKEVFPVIRNDNQGGVAEIECGVDKMEAPRVWDELGIHGTGTVVGIIDTGCCITHPDLANHIWTNPGEIAGNGIDDDNNGYIDDIHGWNFESNNNDISDLNEHGTHTTGTVCGDGTNGTQTGMAPDTKMMILKFYNSFSGEQSVWDSMQYGVDNGADIETASLGWPHSFAPDRATWRAVCENTIAAGVLVVYAAGNEGSCCGVDSVRTPGDVPSVITAGATDCNDVIAYFSSTGPVTWQDVPPYNDYPYPPGFIKPTVCAPGVDTKSTYFDCQGYTLLSGTSMATPHIAGALALMLEANPALEQADASEILSSTALDLGDPGNDNTYGAGRVNAYDAVVASMSGQLPMLLSSTDLIAGVFATLTCERATPGNPVAFTYSITGTGSTYVAQLNVTLGLANPVLGGVRQADGNGVATLNKRIPSGTGGTTVWMQAAEQGNTSNIVQEVVQ